MKRTVRRGEKKEEWKAKIRTGDERTERRVGGRRDEERMRYTEERLRRSDLAAVERRDGNLSAGTSAPTSETTTPAGQMAAEDGLITPPHGQLPARPQRRALCVDVPGQT